MSGQADTRARELDLPARVSVISHEVVDSTNAVARAMAGEGAPAWTVVRATEQRAGRGRMGRGWVSPPGNLYTSTILRPAVGMEMWPQLSFVVSLAVATMAEQVAPRARISLKWPNDVLADGEKLSGILLETLPDTGTGPVVILGVGINVAHAPEGARYGASCLDRLAEAPLTLDWTLTAYLRALVGWHDVWERYGFARIREGWTARAHGLGSVVRVSGAPGGDMEGRFTGLAEDGRMIVERPDGVVTLVSAGTLDFIDRGDG